MKEFYLKIKKLKKDAKIDPPAKPGDVGFDVYATKDIKLKPGERYAMPLGIAMEFPEGYGAFVEQRSGLSRKVGLLTIGNVIDAGYRGEVHAIVVNTSNTAAVSIEKGIKIAQIVFHPCPTVDKIEYVEELSLTDRGNKGFGSTGM